MFPVFLSVLWLFTQFNISYQTTTKDFVGVLTGDDQLMVFADGDLVGQNGGSWNAARWFSFSSKTKLIAVSVTNSPGGIGGFLGAFSNQVVTDRSWKCKEVNSSFEDGWERTNYTDDTWSFAHIRNDNSASLGVFGILPSVHWISPANYGATRFICRRRFSEQEKASNSTLISILGYKSTHIISLYLDGVFIAKAARKLTLIRDQHKLQAVQVEDGFAEDVFFIASSSNGVRTDEWWRCTSLYHEDWFLPSYDDSSWPIPFVGGDNFEDPFIASDAKWIGNVFTATKIYCRRNTTLTPVVQSHDTTTASPTRLLQPSPSTVYTRTSTAGSTIASTRPSIAGSTITDTTGSQNNTSLPRAPGTSASSPRAPGTSASPPIAPGTSASPPIAPGTSAPSSTDANKVSTLLIVVIAVSGVTALVIGKHKTNDKWEMNSDDVTVCEELVRGIWKSVQRNLKNHFVYGTWFICSKKGKKEAKSTIIVAVKMLQENATPDQKNDFLEEISLMKAVGSHAVEFASKGDLLSYLRQRRKKVKDTNAPYMNLRENPPIPPRSPDQNNPGSYELAIDDIGDVNVAFSKPDSSIDIRIESAQPLNAVEQGKQMR
ncbi:hypothetical protein OS493_009363 [Desmophyllum pertusum]|uniref:Uncharacterized protein n=1 Tax=Desmophyllum pertusum TaxID=174260 RepID=A0A9W9Z5A5_9CNID|nr:hypothetical protein OS493_009363 [Desmophyllum pertusum]